MSTTDLMPALASPADYVGKSFLIDVIGYIMLQKVDSGKYRVRVTMRYGSPVASFFKPRGTKHIVTHYLSDILYTEEQKTYCQNHVNFLSVVG